METRSKSYLPNPYDDILGRKLFSKKASIIILRNHLFFKLTVSESAIVVIDGGSAFWNNPVETNLRFARGSLEKKWAATFFPLGRLISLCKTFPALFKTVLKGFEDSYSRSIPSELQQLNVRRSCFPRNDGNHF